ncbi:uncharacterized protein FIBRA_07272 [Fibroporia radiculosa]|uniref:Amidase domain-containing protein n=1 Tax=Fibroporia radiculosa TaxID=599839 RepID=J4IBQ4_9APHY|nr:uncharacterized protein FIBRA_07272 [Fibroporia radiculosa]CCM05066.1 predicted protein [Fibroporia radiculosa]
MAHVWQELIADKKKRQRDAIPKDWLIDIPDGAVLDVTAVPERCGLFSNRELAITSTVDVTTLLRRLATGEWSSLEVTQAFYKRAIIAHQVVNCLTEIFIEKALARAAELDAQLKATGKTAGPLHGLPVSLKDQFSISGIETTMGYASWIGRHAKHNAPMVDILYECGAVPFVKTNLPQTLLWIETNNLIFGRTVNPANRTLTAGGSSGGECALIAMRGSPFGLGTDLGGSVRIPAAFNGLYGFKPSADRLPSHGVSSSLAGLHSVRSAVGPISASLDGIITFMRAAIGGKPWLKDPLVVPKAWNEEEYALVNHGAGKSLCFAIMWNDGVIAPHPPIVRALKMTKDALLAAGHRVIDWQPHQHLEIGNLINNIWRAGSGEELRTVTSTSGEPILASMGLDENTAGTSFFASGDGISSYDLWQLNKKLLDVRKQYLDLWQNSAEATGTGRPIDAIICPAAPCAAPPHGMNRYSNYTRVWNALDHVAAVFPVTKVNPIVDVKQPEHDFMSPLDKIYYEMYEPSTFLNAPVGLQIVGRTLEEEAVEALMSSVDLGHLTVFPWRKL